MKVAQERWSHWDNVHRNNDRYWLGLSSPQDVFRFHQVDPRGMCVMDIGVGTGAMSRALYERKNAPIYCVDVCEPALEKIHPETYARFFDAMPLMDNNVELAICHLVSLHCDDAELDFLMRSVPLAPGGKLSMQYAWMEDYYEDEDTRRGLIVFRDPLEMQAIAARSGRLIKRNEKIESHEWNGQIMWWGLLVLERAQL